jgi:hypothetical protein
LRLRFGKAGGHGQVDPVAAGDEAHHELGGGHVGLCGHHAVHDDWQFDDAVSADLEDDGSAGSPPLFGTSVSLQLHRQRSGTVEAVMAQAAVAAGGPGGGGAAGGGDRHAALLFALAHRRAHGLQVRRDGRRWVAGALDAALSRQLCCQLGSVGFGLCSRALDGRNARIAQPHRGDVVLALQVQADQVLA